MNSSLHNCARSGALRAALWVALVLTAAPTGFAAASVWVYPADDGRLIHHRDALGNRIPDFSNCGYEGGRKPIPDVPVKATVAPVAGDDADSIQAAIDAVAALPLDTTGFRGAVLLQAGEYDIADHIEIRAGGIVLRGVGDATVLRATGTSQRALVQVRGSGSRSITSGTTHNIVDKYVPVGARSFNVDSTSGLAVGESVLVFRPSPQEWIDALGMDQLENPWTPGSRNINSDRVITRIEGNRIFIDAPITTALESQYGGGTIRQYTWSGRIQNVGIEFLHGISDYNGTDTDEAHSWTFIQINSTENGWVRNVTSEHFANNCVSLVGGAKWISVLDCQALDPISQITGGRRYAFNIDDAELCLMRGCYTRQDRHQFVTGSNTAGPHAFVDGLSDGARSDAGPHHRWAHGILWDQIEVNGHQLNIQNRGNLGSGHGWAGGNCVAWNCDASGGFTVQNPPTAHNWLVGSIGSIRNGTVYVGPHDPGTYDAHGTNTFPNSLYHQQLQDRLATPRLQIREYVAGDFDAFDRTNGPANVTPVDSDWLTQITTRAGGAANITNFDALSANKWIPWTHRFQLQASEKIVNATLLVSVRAIGTGWTDDQLLLDDPSNALPVAAYAPTIPTSGSTLLVIDLATNLGLLSDGRLNLALQDDLAVDWSVLELYVAPVLTTVTNVLRPEADTYVRGGTFAGSTFGNATTLVTKEDSNPETTRRSLLRWNLLNVKGHVLGARVRLMPISVGITDIENAVRVVPSDTWTETGTTWNNEPAASYRFASWLTRAGQPVEFDVTVQALEALAGDRRLSLQLYSVRNVGGSGLVDYASAEDSDPARQPQLTLLISNTPPVISPILDRFVPAGADTGPIAFTIDDEELHSVALSLTASSLDTNLVPLSNISFGGSASNRTVTVTPANASTGAVDIAIAVSDGVLTTTETFRVSFGVTNTPPGISNFADRSMSEDGSINIPFTVGDREITAGSLIVAGHSSNQSLVPGANIVFGGSGSNRSATITPLPNANGTTLVTISASDGAASVSNTFTLTVIAVNDRPDTVALTSPIDGDQFNLDQPIVLNARATDPDTNLARVDFLIDGALLARDTNAPYRFTWTDLGLGTFSLQAVATDANGLGLTSAPVTVSIAASADVVVPFGANWHYLDTGVPPPANWYTLAFNDSSWPIGSGELGYGDDDEITVVDFGPNDTNKFITTWFRHSFSLPQLPDAAWLMLNLIRDDGVRVYLNGAEVLRNNLPVGSIIATTRAETGITGAAETNILSTNLPLATLVSGANLLAVEVHQNSPTSSDLSFDLQLVATNRGISALVSAGAVWRFNDTGSDLGTGWRALAFSDSAWSNGVAQLGFGEGDEATLIASNRQITTYFRRAFVVTDPAIFPAGVVRLLRDDGAVVYLNATEIFRSNLPTNTAIAYNTPALSGVTGSAEDAWHVIPFDSNLLRVGTNVIAVEIHQNDNTSSDVSFDLELLGYPAAALPRLSITQSPGAISLRWPAWAASYVAASSASLAPGSTWTQIPNPPTITDGQATLSLPLAPVPRFFRLVKGP